MILLSKLLNEIGDTAQSYVPRNQIRWTVGSYSLGAVLRGVFETPNGLMVQWRIVESKRHDWHFIFSVGGEVEKGADTTVREYLGILATVAEVILKWLEEAPEAGWIIRSVDITGSDKQGAHSGQKNRIYLQVFKRYEQPLRKLGYRLDTAGNSLTLIPVAP